MSFADILKEEILGESDEFIARKVKCALDHDITPILCVGETKDEHDAGKTEEKIETQVGQLLRKSPLIRFQMLLSLMNLSGRSAQAQRQLQMKQKRLQS